MKGTVIEMAFSFKKAAVKAVSMSTLMNNRDKISVDDIIAKYPNGVSITAFDVVQNGEDDYPIFTFAEDDTKFFTGGTVLKKIVEEWIQGFDGDISAATTAYAESAGNGEVVIFKLFKRKSKTAKRDYTAVEII